MDENSDCLTLIPEGEDYYVCNINDGWTEIAVDDDIRGFVKSEYVDVTYDNPRAVSVEEQAEADRIAKEEADRAWLEYLAQQEALQQAQAAEVEQTVTEAPAVTETQVAETQPVEQTTEAQPVAEETTVTETPAAEPVAETPVEEAPAPEPEPTPTAAPAGSTGVDLVNYAMQFVGNPYVWGGTSLTNGADCSGFVQSVYAAYGYSLPRVAASQAGCGVEVSLSDLQPGDLLFYSYDGSIGHVAIYAGGGTVVHASNSRDGIKTSSYNYRTPVKACRIIGQ
ncbi:MAG: C40 family peptidase [Eubacterium sp.]|nr:C40 family peptidase [Eubacterium sp.]